MLRRQPVGVVVVTVDLEGEQLGLTVASFVSLALEPPLVGISIARQAALHELLRAAGGFAVSMLAAGQVELARHFARGVPPLVLWQGIETLPGNRAPLSAGAVGWLDCARRSPARGRRPHLLRRPRRARGARRRRPGARPGRRGLRMIDAVVFDLDGVIVDSEQVWDAVRERLVRERGGRWTESAQRDMMGMSSPEWSRYLHEELGLEESPAELNAEVVRRMLERYRDELPLHRRRSRSGRAPRRRLPPRCRIVVEPTADRRRPGIRRDRGPFRGDRLLGGGRPRQAGARRLPGGGTAARSRSGPLRRSRRLVERPPLRARRRDARPRVPEPALPAGAGRSRTRRRRAPALSTSSPSTPSRPSR